MKFYLFLFKNISVSRCLECKCDDWLGVLLCAEGAVMLCRNTGYSDCGGAFESSRIIPIQVSGCANFQEVQSYFYLAFPIVS